jgi:hypothetical protein
MKPAKPQGQSSWPRVSVSFSLNGWTLSHLAICTCLLTVRSRCKRPRLKELVSSFPHIYVARKNAMRRHLYQYSSFHALKVHIPLSASLFMHSLVILRPAGGSQKFASGVWCANRQSKARNNMNIGHRITRNLGRSLRLGI